MKSSIYLDNNATTALDPRVISAMVQSYEQDVGNPSSVHSAGRHAHAVLEKARRAIASYLGVKQREVIFTSSGTEAVNMMIRGICHGHRPGHILTSCVEHSCVFATVQEMQRFGWTATFLAPGEFGAVTKEAVQAAITPQTALIAIMAVNNETGVKSDLEGIAQVAKDAGIPLLVDGVALMGKELFAIPAGVTAMSFSGHKFHGPKGAGILCLRTRHKLPPLLTGGGQEFGLRSGTENLPAIVGLAQAVEILRTELPEIVVPTTLLRDRLEAGICAACPDVSVNGTGPRVGNTTNLAFSGIDGESLLINLDQSGIEVSHGSACASGALEPSRILLNMGLSLERARSSLRFSLSRFTTQDEVDRCIQIVAEHVTRLRT